MAVRETAIRVAQQVGLQDDGRTIRLSESIGRIEKWTALAKRLAGQLAVGRVDHWLIALTIGDLVGVRMRRQVDAQVWLFQLPALVFGQFVLIFEVLEFGGIRRKHN